MLKRAFQRIFHRRRHEQEQEQKLPVVEAAPAEAIPTAAPPRVVRRQSDIGVDVLSRTYTPRHASGKASFRSDGSDHQRDQDFEIGAGVNRWNDEDRYTNKSNDPRIGTHRRTGDAAEPRDSES